MPVDQPIRYGILGTGRIVPKLAAAIRLARDTVLVAIASRDRGRADAVAAEQGVARAYGSYRDLLDDPQIDVVLNALHNGLHCEWTIRALEAGKHVLCEKPLARSAAEAEQMFTAAGAQRRWLLEGMMYRFHPQMIRAAQLVVDGAIGDLVHIRANYLSRGREPENPRYRRATGGGALLDLGCYCVNLARLFAVTDPCRVTAHARYDAATGIDLTFAGTLAYDNGLTAQFACSFESEGVYSADVVGTAGRVHLPHPWRPPSWPAEIVLVRSHQAETIRLEPAGLPPDLLLSFALEIEHLNDCIRHDRPPCFPGGVLAETESRANARTLDALAAAARDR